MKRNGTIAIPNQNSEGKYETYKYEVTCFENPDPRGLEGGRIDHLQVTRKGELIAKYSGGWLLEPTCREAEMAVAILMIENE